MTDAHTRHAYMIDYLRKLYPVPLLQRGDVSYAVRVYEPQPEQITDIDSFLGALPQQQYSADTMTAYNRAYLHSLQNGTYNLYNGLTFILRRLRPNPLRIEADLGTYFDMLATCAALEQELRDAAVRRFIRLPLRSQYHREHDPTAALLDGRGRSAALGGVVLTVYNDDGVYTALLARRSARNATDPGFFHTLPAFMFQPQRLPVDPLEWRFSHHVYREFLEELFAMPETPDAPPDHFYNHPALRDLQAMQADGRAGLYFTGVGLNLLTLRPEITGLLLIHDPDWIRRVSEPDSAYPLNASAEAQDGRVVRLPIADDAGLLAALPADSHLRMPPQAAAALWQGVDLARQLIAARQGR